MMNVRRAEDRGHFDFGWLNTYHTFSFGEYYDPRFMGFRDLRVINEDRVREGRGFPTHPHRDMEIISYVLDGALEHKDSMGNGSVIRPGEVQRMSAGTGVTHSEKNHSPNEAAHFLQIWIVPSEQGLKPGYEQKMYSEEEKRGRLRLIASSNGRDGSVTVHQDTNLYAGLLDKGEEVAHTMAQGRYAWLQVARGMVEVNGHQLKQGDGASISEEQSLSIAGLEPSEILLFDLA